MTYRIRAYPERLPDTLNFPEYVIGDASLATTLAIHAIEKFDAHLRVRSQDKQLSVVQF